MTALNLSQHTLTTTQIERLHQLMDRGDAFISTDVEKCSRVLLESQEVKSFEGQQSADESKSGRRFSNPRFVGSGAFGIVFFAFDESLGLEVAIKLLRPSRNSGVVEQRFLEEAKITASLSHPGIIRLFDSGTIGGIPYISSTIADGGSLADLITQYPHGLDARLACELMIQVADSVAFAHSKATFHRDLKPGNILLENSTDVPGGYRTVVSDFGLAKRWNQGSNNAALTLDGDLLGTARYMSPEQAAGDVSAFAITSEVFTLGIILYEMLTGQQPFDGDTNAEIRRQILEVQPASPRALCSDVPKDLDAIVMQCLQKSPEDRYESVASLARDLRRFRDYEPVEAAKPTWVRRVLWQASKHPIVSTVMTVSLLVVFVSFAAIGTAWWWQSQAWQKQLQTKMDYVGLLGSLIDDVMSGEKDQNAALIESLDKFESNVAKDLEITPSNLKLRHLQSVLSNYQAVVLFRQRKYSESFRCRVNSVAILKELRAEYPNNAKIRYQYIYGAMGLVDTLSNSYTDGELPYCQSKLGWPDCESIVDAMLIEIPQLLKEFPNEIEYLLGCYDFQQRIVSRRWDDDPELAERLSYVNVIESKRIADAHPEKPIYIKPALVALLSLATKCINSNRYADALRHAQGAMDTFEHYLKPIKLPWVRVLMSNCEAVYVEVLLVNEHCDQAFQRCAAARQELADPTGEILGNEYRITAIQYVAAKRLDRRDELPELQLALLERAKLMPPGFAAHFLAKWARQYEIEEELLTPLEREP